MKANKSFFTPNSQGLGWITPFSLNQANEKLMKKRTENLINKAAKRLKGVSGEKKCPKCGGILEKKARKKKKEGLIIFKRYYLCKCGYKINLKSIEQKIRKIPTLEKMER